MPDASDGQAQKRHAILYYSRDGHTARLAKELANRLDADLIRINTGRYSGTFLGYLRAGFDSLTGRLPRIAPIPNLSDYASVSLGAPIWTSYPATPMRAYLAGHPKLPEVIGMFTTSGGVGSQDKAIAMARALTGKPFVATLNIAKDAVETEQRISDYCAALATAPQVARSA